MITPEANVDAIGVHPASFPGLQNIGKRVTTELVQADIETTNTTVACSKSGIGTISKSRFATRSRLIGASANNEPRCLWETAVLIRQWKFLSKALPVSSLIAKSHFLLGRTERKTGGQRPWLCAGGETQD